MFEMLRTHQLDIMLLLCGACGSIILLLFITSFLPKNRKKILILMEIMGFFLLWFDRYAYVYRGDPSALGYFMVRISNFLVFFLTSGLIYGFNLYLTDWLMHEGGVSKIPIPLRIVQMISVLGMLLAVISALTGLYYYFDETNTYHRGAGFLIAYIIPVLCSILQYSVVNKNRKRFSRLIYIAMILYIFVPIAIGIIQIFTYGISLVNMAMIVVVDFLYIFTYLDINNTAERAHKMEMEEFHEEQKSMKRLFDQTATAFVKAVEKKDDFEQGHSEKVAEYAKRIAELAGKSAEECDQVYYAALLHDVGLIGIPDIVIKNEGNPGQWDYETIRQKPVIAREILSNITEYPYLSLGAYYSHERYNGSGYPEGLKAQEIPEIARIVAVADAYVTMKTKKRYREARPDFVVREAFIKGAGVEFDPEFADCMVRIIDADSRGKMQEDAEVVETELSCGEYRDHITNGIPVESTVIRITFDSVPTGTLPDSFSMPSIILFDSLDRRVHTDEKAIREYQYIEFGEIWFDNHNIITAAREIKEMNDTKEENAEPAGYEIIAGRFEDHLKLKMRSPNHAKEVVVALPGNSKTVYIGLTGEQCTLSNINIEQTQVIANSENVPRIAEEISYIDRFEADVKNVQIDRARSAATEGIELKDRMEMRFHTMSLPGAGFVWNCPYIVLFYSDDQRVNGENYREYALIKLNGENEDNGEFAENRFSMKKKDDFPGWEEWKQMNKTGVECEVWFEKKGNRIITITENLGIYIENVTEIADDTGNVYVALTGDQCAITDIRLH